MREQEIFTAALEMRDAEERESYLDEVCGDDLLLRERVETLLAVHPRLSGFMERSADTPISPGRKESLGDSIGPYTLLEQIGVGGMGVVYLAQQAKPIKRLVALKVVKPGMDTRSVIARFEAERQALAMLDHPHIAKVLDAGDTPSGGPYFVLELVRGVPITEYCDRSSLTTHERLELFIQVCQAIDHANRRGIVHRDIKPSNVMIEMRDGHAAPKIIDFGVAKALGERLTDITLTTCYNQMIGTPAYMSPEQAELSPLDVDGRSDVYSLGVLLYELLTGTTPFEKSQLKSAGFDELRRIIREDDPPRPSTRVSTLGNRASTLAENRRTETRRLSQILCGDLDWIVMKALEKNRQRRYQSAGELADDVGCYLSDRPIAARPQTVFRNAIKWGRRHSTSVMAASAVLLVTTLALAVSTVLILSAYRRETSARESESEARRAETAALAQATESLKTAQRHRFEARRAAYVSEMRHAFQLYETNLGLDAQAILNAQVPEEGQEDLRGVEWHFLSTQIDQRFQTIGRHTGGITDIDVFPDGDSFVTAGEDGVVRVWSAATLSLVREFHLQASPVYTVGVSPDGKWLAYGDGKRNDPNPKRVILLEAQTGAVLRTLNEHSSTIRQIRFSPDGRFVVSSGAQEKLAVWEFSDGTDGRSYDLPCEQDVPPEYFDLQFVGDHHLLTEFHDRHGFRVWDIRTGEAIHDFPDRAYPEYRDPKSGNVGAFAWSQAASRMAFVPKQRGGRLHVMDIPDGSLVGNVDLTDSLTCLDFSPQGDRVCIGTEAGQLLVRRSPDGASLESRKLHNGAVSRLRFLDKRRAVSGGVDGRVVMSRDRTRANWESPFARDGNTSVTKMATSPGNDLLAWSGVDGAVRLAEHTTGRILVRAEPLTGPVAELAWSGDGSHLAAISMDGQFACWRVDGHLLVECLRDSVGGEVGMRAGLALSHDGSRLYLGGVQEPDGYHVWDVSAARHVRFVPTLYMAREIAVSPDDRLLIVAWDELFVFDRLTDTLLHRLPLGGTCTSLLFAADDETLVAGYKDGSVRLWDPAAGQLKGTLTEHDPGAKDTDSLLFSNDGRTLIAGSPSQLRFWNAETWKFLGRMVLSQDIGTRHIFSMSITPESDALDLIVGWPEPENRHLARIPLRSERLHSAAWPTIRGNPEIASEDIPARRFNGMEDMTR